MILSQKSRVPKLRLTLPAILKLMSRTADGMFAVDSNGKILSWNPSAAKILGYRAKEVIGKPCHEIIAARDPSGNLFCFQGCAVMTMAKEDRLIRNYDTQVMTKGKSKIWLNTSILLVQSKVEAGPLVVHLFRPIAPPRGEKGYEKKSALTPSRHRSSPSYLHQKKEQPASPASKPPSLKRPVLSPREREVLVYLSRCLVAKEIATKLKISTETARTHIQHILKKLHAHSKLEAVMLAAQQGLL